MRFDEVQRMVESARAPRTKFSFWLDPFRHAAVITCTVRVRDIKTRKRDWIRMEKTYSLPIGGKDIFGEQFWKDQLRRLLQELMEHEIDEHLEIGGEKPFYPHVRLSRGAEGEGRVPGTLENK